MNYNGSIAHSEATGNVTGINQVGGLAGNSTGSVTDSNASGKVIGTFEVGGLIGSVGASVNRSYATGDVEALDENAYKVGGLIGGSSASVENSYATGSVTANGDRIGGLIGDQYMRKVANSYALGHVTGKNFVGGLIGFGDTFPLEHSFASGTVEGNHNVGGLVGYLMGSAALTNNIATGQVTGVEYVGGLVGQDSDNGNAQISSYMNQMAFGDVSGVSRVGGLAGSCACFIEQSYAEGDVTGTSGSQVGGLAGSMPTGKVKNSYAKGKARTVNTDEVGGLVGYVRNSVETSYATGDVIADGALYGGLAGSIAYPENLINSYYSGNASDGNNLGKKLTEQQLKQIGQLQGFGFVNSASMENPWLIVPGETTPFPRNGHAAQPAIQLNGPVASSVNVGDQLQLSGQVALGSVTQAVYEDSRVKPLYVFYNLVDQNGQTLETKVIVRQPNPGAVESFNGSVAIDSAFATNQSYTLEIWAMTKKGGVSVSKHDFGVYAPADIELEAESPDGSDYTENEWTGRDVIVRAAFGSDIPGKRNYAVTGPSVIDPASVTGWQSYVEPIELKDSGEYIVWIRTENGIGQAAIRNLRVRVDKELPDAPDLILAGSMPQGGWSSGPAIVTLTDGTDTLSGADYTEYKLGASGAWTRYASGIQAEDEGQTKIYARTVDKAGNVGAEAELEIRIDLTGPSEPTIGTTGLVGADGWANGPVTVTLTDGADALSGADYTEYKLGASGTWTRYASAIRMEDEGHTKIYARTVDKVGHVGAEAELEIRIDLTDPAEPTMQATGPIVADGWASGPVTVTVADGTDALSGVDYTEYKIGYDGTWTRYVTAIPVEDEGITQIYARTADLAGNTSAEAKLEIQIDETAPAVPTMNATGPLGASGWASGTVSVTLADGTDALSGVDYTEYKLGANGTWTRYASGIQVEGEGHTNIYARTVDKAGHVGAEAELEVRIDLAPPSEPTIDAAGPTGAAGWANGPVTVTLTDGTDALSGADYTEYKLGASGTWTRYASAIRVEDEGHTKIYARTVDKVGHVGAEAELEVRIDLAPPSEPTIDAAGPIGAAGWANGPITVTLSDGTDTLSGVIYSEYKLGAGGTWTKYAGGISLDSEGIAKIYARTVDRAGNVGVESEWEAKIDQSGPSEPVVDLAGPSAPNGTDSWQSGPVTVTITDGMDALSGSDYTEYKVDNGDWMKFTAAFTVEGRYETTIYARTVDKAGNTGNEQSRKVTITGQKPSPPSPGGAGGGGSPVVDPELPAQGEPTPPSGSADKMDEDRGTDDPAPALSDMQGHWAEASVKAAMAQGIVKGYADGTFKPDRPVTRAEFIVMLASALKLQGEAEELDFTDRSKFGAWASAAIAQAVAAGIANGYGDGSFGPDKPITRAEMAMMLANALGERAENAAVTGFADDGSIPAWAKGAAKTMRSLGIVNGRTGNNFAPNDRASRAEAVTVILRMLNHQGR